jgi:hypothetical protein
VSEKGGPSYGGNHAYYGDVRDFHHTHDVRMRERYQCILLLMDGQSCPESVDILNRAAGPFSHVEQSLSNVE